VPLDLRTRTTLVCGALAIAIAAAAGGTKGVDDMVFLRDGERCWFTDYLPDFNFTNGAARDASVSNAIQWISDAGIDGFRLDAVKHIEDSWLLDLRARVKSEIEAMTMEHFYMVGETYTGDRDLIKYYVKPEMLDGQFDFPWRMKVAENLIMRQGSMKDLESFMNSNDGYYGTGVMSPFIGNHDIPRVIHLAEDTPVWASPWDGGKDKAWAGTPTLPLPRCAPRPLPSTKGPSSCPSRPTWGRSRGCRSTCPQ